MTRTRRRSERSKWDHRYATGSHPAAEEGRVQPFLAECIERGLLPDPVGDDHPARGRALDLGGGAGGCALHLAEAGWRVDLLDLSLEGLRLARARAERAGVGDRIRPVCADARQAILPPGRFDLALNLHFLERAAWPELIGCLRPGVGVLVMEAFLVAQVEQGRRPGNPAFCVEPGELAESFNGLEILELREEDDGEIAAARLCARKPLPGP